MKIKRIALLFLALTMTVACFGAVGASAADEAAVPRVRVNGRLIEFPDAQPFIDENDRTLIPVRFVAEHLGAEVSWNAATQTASVEKDGILVEINIGNAVLRVTENGRTKGVSMDTAAVLRGNRTYVPIRFVAEALGAFVDYSDVYRTVGIYSEALTPEQISMLMALPYTKPESTLGYVEAKQKYDAEALAFFYGTDRDSFQAFANAREHLYHVSGEDDLDAIYADVVDHAVSAVEYASDNVTVRFLADASCIYQPDSMDRLLCTVRGIAVVQLKTAPLELPGRETAMLCALGMTTLEEGTMRIPVDIHMNTGTEGTVSVHTLVPAGAQY